MAKAYRPKGDSILYALVGILQDPILFIGCTPLQDLFVVAGDHYLSHYHSFPVTLSILRRLPRITSLPRPPHGSRLAPRAAPAAALRPENFPTLPPYFFLPLGFPMCCL